MSCLIQLTQGQWAEVDDEDFDRVIAAGLWFFDSSNGYARRDAKNKKREYLHKFIAQEFVDHEDGNKLNNRRYNLRPATVSQNMCNRKRARSNKSGYKGVSWHKKAQKWCATISADKKFHYLGLFETAEAAYDAYCEAAKRLHKGFARLK